MSKFSERLVLLRKERNLSQAKVASGIGKKTRVYQRYEYDESDPGLKIFISLAKFYNVSLDYLAGLSDDPGQFPAEPPF